MDGETSVLIGVECAGLDGGCGVYVVRVRYGWTECTGSAALDHGC